MTTVSDRLGVALLPAGERLFLRAAIVDGGGDLVDPAHAQALVWVAADDPDGLRRTLAAHPHLRWVQLPWAGIEPYLTVLDRARVWTAGQGVYAVPAAEHALTLALAGLRQLPARARAISWHRPLGPRAGLSLVGAKVTILGGGGITSELLRLLAPFQCEVTVVRRHAERPLAGASVVAFADRRAAIATADVVILALALTAETRHCIGESELMAMKPTAWLVNVARGAHVDTAALVRALQAERIGGAALDVTDPEPLPDGHPLWTLPNVLLTQHTGGGQHHEDERKVEALLRNLERLRHSQPLENPVDLSRGY